MLIFAFEFKPSTGLLFKYKFSLFFENIKIKIMDAITRRKMLVADIVGQVMILMLSLIFIRFFILFLFIGRAWQLLSFFAHNKYREGLILNISTLYWKLTRAIPLLMPIALFSFGLFIQLVNNVFGILFFITGAISFLGGNILYIYYLFVSMKDLLLETQKESV